MYYFTELFNGIKKDWASRSYHLLFFLRRGLLWVMIISFTYTSKFISISIYTIFQILYCSIIWAILPFSELKDNILELTNEMFYTALWLFLLFYNSKPSWDPASQTLYISLLMLNNVIFTIISLGKVRKFKQFSIPGDQYCQSS
jgi:hypothetical protein